MTHYLKSLSVLSIILVVFCLESLPAQRYALEQTTYTTTDGLSHSAVNSFYEDSRQLVWLCTRFGVNRFDGEEFRAYTRVSHGLHSSDIANVYEDPDGLIWMLTGLDPYVLTDFSGQFGYTIFDPLAEKVVPASSYLPPAMLEDLDGCNIYLPLPDKSLLFISNQGYLLHYRGKNDFVRQEFAELPGLANRPIPVNDQAFYLQFIDFENRGVGKDIFYRTDGSVIKKWPLTKSPAQNLEKPWLTGFSENDYLPNIVDGRYFRQFQDTMGNAGYYAWPAPDGNWAVKSVYDLFPELRKGEKVGQLMADEKRGRYWLQRGADIQVWETGYGLVATLPNASLPRYLRTDSFGNVYGINRQRELIRYTLLPVNFTREGLIGLPHRAIAAISTDSLWVGIDKSAAQRPYTSASPAIMRAYNQALMRDHLGNIWSGMPTNASGGTQFTTGWIRRIAKGNPQHITYFPVTDTVDSEIWAIWEDPTDWSVWAANIRAQVYRTDPKTGISEVILDGNHPLIPASTFIYAFTRDARNRLWMSTSSGLFTLDQNHKITAAYSAQKTGAYYIPATKFHHCYIDAEQIFWLSTGDGGLIRWSPDGKVPIRQYTMADGLPSMVVHAAYEDSLGYLWLPTENGILQINKKTSLSRAYGPGSGTSDTEYNRVAHFRSPEGRLYFGGMTGITSFHPRDFHAVQELTPGNTYLEVIDVLQKEGEEQVLTNRLPALRKTNEITIFPGSPRAVVRFNTLGQSARTFSVNSQIIGWQNEPIPLKDGRIVLEDLPFGHHKLVVSALNLSGELLEQQVFRINVVRPVYLRWWFLTLLGLLVGGIAWFIAALDNRRLRSLVRERTQTIERDKQLIEEQASALRELDEHKSRFFANISHELRTPLTLIIGPVKRLLQRQDLPAEAFDGLRRAHSNGERLQRMVNDILDLSKLEEGKLQAFPEPTPIGPFLQYLCGLFTTLAEQNELQLTTDMSLPEGLIIEIDRQKIETIVRNLLANAIKFTPAGGQVKLSARWENGELCLDVSDTGQGIDERDLPKLFDRFYQARHGTSQLNNASGTGIGLAICRELAQLMGGRIAVKSVLGEGSTFTLRIPASSVVMTEEENYSIPEIYATNPALVARPQVQTRTERAGKNTQLPHLLIVEDNPELREYLDEILHGHYQVTLAGNGGEALAQLEAASQLPDLIITDLMMPVMDGFELLRTLKDNPVHRLIPTIVLSSRSAASDRLNVLGIGIDDYVLKPFDEKELLQRIHNLLTNARARAAATAATPAISTSPAPAAAPDANDTIHAQADAKLLTELRESILANLEDPDFGNEELAALHFISPRTLSRRIKAMTGLSTNKFMLEIRLNQARELLETSPRPNLSEVAEKVGFKKASYFSARFRERFGILPSEYAL